MSGNHKTKSPVPFRLLTQSIEAPKKRNTTVRVTNLQKEKVEKDNSELNRKKAAVPVCGSNTIWASHNPFAIPLCIRIKSDVALNVA